MDQEALLKAIAELGAALRTEVSDSIDKLSKRCDAMSETLAKGASLKAADNDGDDMAEQVAADSVSRGEFRAVQQQLNGLLVAQPRRRNDADRNLMADMQARCDAAYRSLGERADAPMAGEELVDYTIRLHRGLQSHSKKWGKAELATIARDRSTFSGVCDAIRADAIAASMSPVGMPEFARRKIVTQSAGGHQITDWVGNGTIFKELSRPVRTVIGIGGNDKFAKSQGGSFTAN
jgi:hypothetical protein